MPCPAYYISFANCSCSQIHTFEVNLLQKIWKLRDQVRLLSENTTISSLPHACQATRDSLGRASMTEMISAKAIKNVSRRMLIFYKCTCPIYELEIMLVGAFCVIGAIVVQTPFHGSGREVNQGGAFLQYVEKAPRKNG